MNITDLYVGQLVYWNDPANETSGYYTVLNIPDTNEEDAVILIGDGCSEAEVYASELSEHATKCTNRKVQSVYLTVRVDIEVPENLPYRDVEDMVSELDYDFTLSEGCVGEVVNYEICGVNE